MGATTLETVGLWKKVTSDGSDRLDTELSVADWPVGEHQLLALARMDAHCRVLCLSVDWETEATMQAVTEQEFASQTVISVVHRLRFIERYDRGALLKTSRLVEYGCPKDLLARQSEFGLFYQMQQME
ncbi:hypothetical protein NUU61_005983 [Penicillium alfredii]|uniref:Uncharacterized protein n=1 Tax=Penicillium alfredii TaxID=1506179 RepID=A0A9W9F045_9EURO|nr:uncharacterized protein NUU61_005983 [Penicillium alfredii]KAJ5091113.1 hypothetical protein NUU61_005983 [Penicillium alfredii]